LEAAKLALEYWIKKGKIAAQGASCGSSYNGCGDANESYQWVINEKIVRWL